MPLYQYICECGAKNETWRPMSDCRKKKRCNCCGRMAKRLLGCRIPPPRATGTIRSSAMGVWDGQQAEATAHARGMGLTGFEYIEGGDEAGDIEFADKKSRRKFAEAMGFHDRDAGYSDPTPTTESKKEEMEDDNKNRGLVEFAPEDTANDGRNEPLFVGGDGDEDH